MCISNCTILLWQRIPLLWPILDKMKYLVGCMSVRVGCSWDSGIFYCSKLCVNVFLTCGTHSEQLHRVGNNSGCVIRVNLAGHCIGSVVMLYTCMYGTLCVCVNVHTHKRICFLEFLDCCAHLGRRDWKCVCSMNPVHPSNSWSSLPTRY